MDTIYMEKEIEDKKKAIYKFGPLGNLTGKILIRKNSNPYKDLPEITTEIENFENSRLVLKRVVSAASDIVFSKEYPNEIILMPPNLEKEYFRTEWLDSIKGEIGLKIDKELIELLDRIKGRPILYIGSKSLILLSAFINGYFFYKKIGRSENSTELIPGFQKWVCKKVNIETNKTWSNIITFVAGSDENAFDMFYELLEEFLKDETT